MIQNKSKVIAFAVVSAIVTVAISAPPSPPAPSASGKKFRDMIAAKAGGYVYSIEPGKSLKIVNGVSWVDATAISAVVEDIKDRVLITVKTGKGAFGPEELADKDAGAWVFLEENDTNPVLLVAPEEAWAKINVKKLKADNPAVDVLTRRIQKEIWRGAAIAMGGSSSEMQPSLMRNIKNLKMLDVAPNDPMPDTFNLMISFARERDFATVKRATYRLACRQGWAPAPTNELQKAIWDKVHELPSNPIKIEFDPKKGK